MSLLGMASWAPVPSFAPCISLGVHDPVKAPTTHLQS